VTDIIQGTLPQADPYAQRGVVEAGVNAVAPPPGPAWIHGNQAYLLSPVFDARALIWLERGAIGKTLALALADGQAGVDRVLKGDTPLSVEDVQACVEAWAKAQGADLGESKV
jgi:hypothetical protein